MVGGGSDKRRADLLTRTKETRVDNAIDELNIDLS